MTLDQLRAELAALALAYPGETPVAIDVPSHGYRAAINLIAITSEESVVITLEGAD